MAFGPGKYDDATTAAREATGAAGVVLIVIHGRSGHGFSVQVTQETMAFLPAMLEQIAADIRETLRHAPPPRH